MGSVLTAPQWGRERFSHEVAFYRGLEDLARTVLPFVREGLARGEAVMVALLSDRSWLLQQALGPDAARVQFVDMAALGGNPACIIPAWHRFVGQTSGPVRGIGEPVWSGRRDVELDEAELHESLLNLAFDDGRAWRLLCPYDLTSLPSSVLDEARRNHPVVHRDLGGRTPYAGHRHALQRFTQPLPKRPDRATTLRFDVTELGEVRSVLRRRCAMAGLSPDASSDLVLAAHELASNSVLHADGEGLLAVWVEPGALVVEVQDTGTIDDPLVGRHLADDLAEDGRGIWMANQLCDLVQVRSRPGRTQVRLHAWL